MIVTININNFGVVLHSWFFIEIQLNEVALNEVIFVKFDKIVNPRKNTFFNKSKYFHLHYVIFFH